MTTAMATMTTDLFNSSRDPKQSIHQQRRKLATDLNIVQSKVNQWCSTNAIVKLQVTMPNHYIYILDARIALSSRNMSHICVHLVKSIPLTHPGAPVDKVLPQGLEVVLIHSSETCTTWSCTMEDIHYRLIC